MRQEVAGMGGIPSLPHVRAVPRTALPYLLVWVLVDSWTPRTGGSKNSLGRDIGRQAQFVPNSCLTKKNKCIVLPFFMRSEGL